MMAKHTLGAYVMYTDNIKYYIHPSLRTSACVPDGRANIGPTAAPHIITSINVYTYLNVYNILYNMCNNNVQTYNRTRSRVREM